MNKVFLGSILCLVLVFSFILVYQYSIPQLIPEDYNCEEHPGFISDSKPFYFESSQNYVDRKNKAIQIQIEEVCD